MTSTSRQNISGNALGLRNPISMGLIQIESMGKLQTLQLDIGCYASNLKLPSIQAWSLGDDDFPCPSPYGRLSTNIDGLNTEPWEVALKDWAENAELASWALKSRLFDSQTRTVNGISVAKINAGALPVGTLHEVAKWYGWDVNTTSLLESVARDCVDRGDDQLIVSVDNREVHVSFDQSAVISYAFAGHVPSSSAELVELRNAIEAGRFSLQYRDSVLLNQSNDPSASKEVILDSLSKYIESSENQQRAYPACV